MASNEIDPVNSTDLKISRRGFAIAGSAALLGAAASSADELGKPHPPFVAEDDPAIVVSRPRLLPAAGGAIGAYAALPRQVRSTTPGVVVIQAIWGVDAQLRDVVRRYAKAGYAAVAPRLYDRVNAPDADGSSDVAAFRPVAKAMFEQGFVKTDIDSAHDWIGSQAAQSKIGITGFCMGGAVVLSQIAGSTLFTAASVFYGSVQPPPQGAISAALLGSYGARDTSIAPADVRAFFEQLSAPHDLKIYDEAGHAFFDDTRARYVASAANDAWRRTLAWFEKYLT
ncbi:MAG TPA: dienelactone hydrolase family protein [Candidatus Baltobacteraceae bacterium]|jgi:carboxymethylenebutenolidase|nr:dienelactone hydrolase family protein [Candidatus Baltobacteraceae bacterium]